MPDCAFAGVLAQEMLEARKESEEANAANAAQNNAHLGLAPLMLTQGPGGPPGACCLADGHK